MRYKRANDSFACPDQVEGKIEYIYNSTFTEILYNLEYTNFCCFVFYVLVKYSLVCFALFCLVKRIVEYFAKEWSEQKLPITDVAGLYSTYQKYIMIPLTLTSLEKNGLEFFNQNK